MNNSKVSLVSSQNCFNPLIEARLADVVHWLRSGWVLHIAPAWGDIHPIHEDARREFEKRVATALREGFFHFSQLLCGFELLLLKSKELGVVPEESVLGLEQLVVQLSDDRRGLVEISDAHRGLPELLGSRDGADGGGDD